MLKSEYRLPPYMGIEEHIDRHINTIANIVLGAKGYSTGAECRILDESTRVSYPFSSSKKTYNDELFHIVKFGNEFNGGKASRLSIYVIEQRPEPSDPSILYRTLPDETLVYENIDGKTTTLIGGGWIKDLDSLIQVKE